MTYIVALTGGIGSGKTTISNSFKKMNIDIIDSDTITKKLIKKNPVILSSIHKKFGNKILNSDGSINRILLRKNIVYDHQKKRWLENLLHPQIYKQTKIQFKKIRSIWCLWVVPLLIEKKLEKYANRVLLVDIPIANQIKRIIKRDNLTKIEANDIISIQTHRSQRISKSDDIIYNIKNLKKLEQCLYYFNILYTFLAKKKYLKIIHLT